MDIINPRYGVGLSAIDRGMQTYDQIAWPWAWYSRSSVIECMSESLSDIPHSVECLNSRCHTGLLNISLLHAAATPVGILAVFALHAGMPLTVKGSGTVMPVVSVTPTTSTSRGAGGLIVIGAVFVESGIGDICAT
jgi:hypothetical protein